MISFKQVAALCGAFALLAPAPALAEWVEVSSSTQHSTLVETSSMLRDGQIVEFWDRTIRVTPNRMGLTTMQYRKAVDCTTGNYILLRTVGFHKGRMIFDESASSEELAIDPAPIPGTAGYAVYNFVCR
jgi:hypothetical protein